VPGGVAAYACCIRNGTTLALDAEELHQLGLIALAEVEGAHRRAWRPRPGHP